MSTREKLLALAGKDLQKKSDALVVLEGDGYKRADHGAKLFIEGRAPLLILSGGFPETSFAIPAARMLPRVIERGVPRDAVILEERSQNTKEQAIEVMRIAKKRDLRSITLVASPEHQARAFLTFLKAMGEASLTVALFNAPTPTEVDSAFLLSDLAKIEEYQGKGDVASYEDGVAYLQSQ